MIHTFYINRISANLSILLSLIFYIDCAAIRNSESENNAMILICVKLTHHFDLSA